MDETWSRQVGEDRGAMGGPGRPSSLCSPRLRGQVGGSRVRRPRRCGPQDTDCVPRRRTGEVRAPLARPSESEEARERERATAGARTALRSLFPRTAHSAGACPQKHPSQLARHPDVSQARGGNEARRPGKGAWADATVSLSRLEKTTPSLFKLTCAPPPPRAAAEVVRRRRPRAGVARRRAWNMVGVARERGERASRTEWRVRQGQGALLAFAACIPASRPPLLHRPARPPTLPGASLLGPRTPEVNK